MALADFAHVLEVKKFKTMGKRKLGNSILKESKGLLCQWDLDYSFKMK